IRRFSDPTPRPIAGTEGAEFPFWSPDSQWVAFFGHNQKLSRVNVATGTLQDLCDADYGVGGAWSGDGTIIFSRRFSDGLYRVPASGGEPVALTRLNPARRESVHGWPHFLSDRRFAFVIRTTGEERNQIAVASLDDPKPKVLMKADSLVGFDRGNLLYVRENTLFAQRLDERTLELKGEPVEIATNVAFSESWGTSGASVSPAGVIAYYPVYLPRVEVRVYDRKGVTLRTVLTDDFIGEPRFSPDGRRIAFSRFDQKKGASDIWIVDVARGIRSRITGGLADHVSPAWSPDGERIAWLSDRDGMYDVLTQQVDSNARPVNIWRGGRDKVSVQWMPDGRSILATVEFPNTLRDIYLGSTTGEKPKPVVTDQSDDEDAVASPDGHWIAFASRHAGGPTRSMSSRRVAVASFSCRRQEAPSRRGATMAPRCSTSLRTARSWRYRFTSARLPSMLPRRNRCSYFPAPVRICRSRRRRTVTSLSPCAPKPTRPIMSTWCSTGVESWPRIAERRGVLSCILR
ncbi:MAG: TolB family protein, partial [Thermoanaerobaculia bacterium]